MIDTYTKLKYGATVIAFILLSSIYDLYAQITNSNVAIGSTSAATSLDIQNNRSTKEGIILNNAHASGGSHIMLKNAGATKFTFGLDNADNLVKFGTDGINTATFLTFTPLTGKVDFTGNVAIGGSSNAKLHVTTSDATNGLRIQNDGADGDPTLEFNLNGTSSFTMGVDDSDNDKFKISSGNALGTTDRLTISSTGAVTISGALATPYAVVTANITVGNGHYYVKGDATGGSFTITLPTAVGNAGRIYYFNHIGGNTLTLDADGTELIGASQTYTLVDLKTVMLVSNGPGWDFTLLN
jgi:hypothetical protein